MLRLGDRVMRDAPQCQPMAGTVVDIRLGGATVGVLLDGGPPAVVIYYEGARLERLNLVRWTG